MSSISKKDDFPNKKMGNKAEKPKKTHIVRSELREKEKTPNWMLMQQARESLTGNWGLSVGIIITVIFISIIITLINILSAILSAEYGDYGVTGTLASITEFLIEPVITKLPLRYLLYSFS